MSHTSFTPEFWTKFAAGYLRRATLALETIEILSDRGGPAWMLERQRAILERNVNLCVRNLRRAGLPEGPL